MLKFIDEEMSKSLLVKRRRLSMTLTELAKQVSITRATLSEIERGRKQVVQIRVFNSLIDWLLEETE